MVGKPRPASETGIKTEYVRPIRIVNTDSGEIFQKIWRQAIDIVRVWCSMRLLGVSARPYNLNLVKVPYQHAGKLSNRHRTIGESCWLASFSKGSNAAYAAESDRFRAWKYHVGVTAIQSTPRVTGRASELGGPSYASFIEGGIGGFCYRPQGLLMMPRASSESYEQA